VAASVFTVIALGVLLGVEVGIALNLSAARDFWRHLQFWRVFMQTRQVTSTSQTEVGIPARAAIPSHNMTSTRSTALSQWATHTRKVKASRTRTCTPDTFAMKTRPDVPVVSKTTTHSFTRNMSMSIQVPQKVCV
jgi:hypothetical protein